MSHSIKIIIDKRESKVIPFFNQYKESITIECQTINTGDYCIIYDDVIVAIIERKRWEDLAASMRDGRKHNVQKLLDLQKETNCTIFYLIEGKAFPPITKKYGNLPVKNLMAHLDHLVFRDKIHMLYTADEKGTAERLVLLAQNYWSLENSKPLPIKFSASVNRAPRTETKSCINKKNLLLFKGLIAEDPVEAEDEGKNCQLAEEEDREVDPNRAEEEDREVDPNRAEEEDREVDPNRAEDLEVKSGGTPLDLLKKSREIKNMTAHEQILRAIPGIGSVKSSLLYTNKVTLKQIYEGKVTEDDIAKMTYPNGVIVGLAVAKQIVKKCKATCSSDSTRHKSRLRILSEIPLISKQTAEVILAKFSFADILAGKVTQQQLADLQKTEKTKLGQKAAENILTYLG